MRMIALAVFLTLAAAGAAQAACPQTGTDPSQANSDTARTVCQQQKLGDDTKLKGDMFSLKADVLAANRAALQLQQMHNTMRNQLNTMTTRAAPDLQF